MNWNGLRVFLTGHTGFKGSWLALWLQQRGAQVHGFALDPAKTPNLYDVAGVAAGMASDTRADLADQARLAAAMTAAQPDVVLHLAAQALVRESYRDPLSTFATNVQGTAHVLEAARTIAGLRAVVIVTTDKVYRSEEWAYPYRETDHLGGNDPYSASKAAAELVVASYRASFFGAERHPAHIASARAGNVIGGGDWSAERLIPDCLRAADAKQDLVLRFPEAVRPWQHVLEPLSGYLALAEALLGSNAQAFAQAWNFGPDATGEATVGAVARSVLAAADGAGSVVTPPREDTYHETGLLRLDSSLARARLAWQPRWSLGTAIDRTVAWHKAWREQADMRATTLGQIAQYEAAPAQ